MLTMQAFPEIVPTEWNSVSNEISPLAILISSRPASPAPAGQLVKTGRRTPPRRPFCNGWLTSPCWLWPLPCENPKKRLDGSLSRCCVVVLRIWKKIKRSPSWQPPTQGCEEGRGRRAALLLIRRSFQSTASAIPGVLFPLRRTRPPLHVCLQPGFAG